MSKRLGNAYVSSTGIQSLESKSAVHRPPQVSTQESTLSFGDVLRKYRLTKKATLGLEILTNEPFDYEMHGVVVDKSKPINTIIYFGVKELNE